MKGGHLTMREEAFYAEELYGQFGGDMRTDAEKFDDAVAEALGSLTELRWRSRT